MDRRRFLTALATVTALGSAGCSSSGGEPSPTDSPTATQGDGSTDTPTPTPTPAPEMSPTDTPTEAGTDTATATAEQTETPTPTPTPRPEVAADVTVAADGQFKFAPETVTVSTGETVRWTWAAGGHNVKPENTPADSDWTGTPGERSKTFGEGYVYTHTFEVTGRFDYICVPHQSLGMKGTVVVE